ncbi:MAG: hypothetical protein WB402_09630 [Sulfuricaulis sp.]|uniref:hypothetical protein n=1 Tax=Sulfuricaulis sp. TaxID=2003553 RepID=UPI003C36778B
MNKRTIFALVGLAMVTLVAVQACGSHKSSGSTATTASRPFYLGSTPFFTTATAFPDWRFENLDDRDLLSVHVDDFLGIPWNQFQNSSTLPSAWVTQWTTLANNARATGKTLYVALSPLGNRTTLAPNIDNGGARTENWAPADTAGCYRFSSDANAQNYKLAYINYAKYIIDLTQPAFFSPAIEMNMQFARCAPADKAAYIAWYSDVHNAIKAAYPQLVVFPTFQLEYLYGTAEPAASCGSGVSAAACFALHLPEALSIPGDRLALSSYPLPWKFSAEYNFSYPTDTYATIQNATARKIWISETGWATVKILQSYQHGASGSCGAVLIPASMANDSELEAYMTWLLGEAQTRRFEAVIWWLNRDYLDAAVADTCPCSDSSDTCLLTDTFYAAAGDYGESLMRVFGNMGLRHYDGSARSALNIWRQTLARPRRE